MIKGGIMRKCWSKRQERSLIIREKEQDPISLRRCFTVLPLFQNYLKVLLRCLRVNNGRLCAMKHRTGMSWMLPPAGLLSALTIYPSECFILTNDLGPVVQSVVSLMSSLRVISLTVLADSTYNFLKFFAEKMWVAFAQQKLLTFFQQKISAYLRITGCKF